MEVPELRGVEKIDKILDDYLRCHRSKGSAFYLRMFLTASAVITIGPEVFGTQQFLQRQSYPKPEIPWHTAISISKHI